MSEQTGSVSINHDVNSSSEANMDCTGCKYDPGLDRGPFGLSRDTWAKLIIWFVPMVFFAGGVYFNYMNMSERVIDNSDGVRNVQKAQNVIEKTQVQQSANIEKISEAQQDVKESIKDIDEKLDRHGNVLSAMKAKFNLRTDSQE